jgi:GDP-4-dehydro-6-deoxy-D-mannose reductase
VAKEFESAGHRVTGTSRSGEGPLIALDLDEPGRIEQVLETVRPDSLVHLAGLQSIPESWRDPARAFRANTGGTAALLRAIEHSAPDVHLVLASTAAVYGEPRAAVPDHGAVGHPAPFDESDPVRPGSPYAASKAAAEVLAGELAARLGLQVTIARLFNQIGADQPCSQNPAGFAARIAEAEMAGESAVTLEVGNPGARRDYTDTRDTARALRLAVEGCVTGTLNVCSGETRPLKQLIERLSKASTVEVRMDRRPGRANRNDPAVLAGSPARLKSATGWEPGVRLDESLAGLLEARREALREGLRSG